MASGLVLDLFINSGSHTTGGVLYVEKALYPYDFQNETILQPVETILQPVDPPFVVPEWVEGKLY